MVVMRAVIISFLSGYMLGSNGYSPRSWLFWIIVIALATAGKDWDKYIKAITSKLKKTNLG